VKEQPAPPPPPAKPGKPLPPVGAKELPPLDVHLTAYPTLTQLTDTQKTAVAASAVTSGDTFFSLIDAIATPFKRLIEIRFVSAPKKDN
jgi:hypothetical protein